MKKKFTLIELLLVIAIIVLLAGMLLPALRNARLSAQKIVCSNNIKQMAAIVSLYESDSDGLLPIPYPSYLPASSTIGISTCVNSGYMKKQTGPAFYKCPINYAKYSGLMDKESPSDNSKMYYYGTYAPNLSIFSRHPPITTAKRIQQIRQPSTIFMWSEKKVATNDPIGMTIFIKTQVPEVYSAVDLADGGIDYAHGQSANFVFFDGHVSSIKYNNVSNFPAYSANPQYDQSIWYPW